MYRIANGIPVGRIHPNQDRLKNFLAIFPGNVEDLAALRTLHARVQAQNAQLHAMIESAPPTRPSSACADLLQQQHQQQKETKEDNCAEAPSVLQTED